MAFFTLGCKVNQYETSALEQQFSENGFIVVSPDAFAEVYVVNSCTVTAQGDQKSRRMLRRFRRQNPAAVVVLCGCFPQAFPEKAESIPEADIVAGSTQRGRLLELVRERLAPGGPGERMVRIIPHESGEPFEPLRVNAFSAHTRAFLKIQDGCRRRCAYCIIPAARGPVRSKAPADLAAELRELAAAGYREVVLVGINLSCYGADFGGTLLDAVTLACGTPGIIRVRLGSLEPELLNREDIEAMARLPQLCPQFHLSLQSGCDATLNRMRRQYDTERYRALVSQLRAAFPGCAITTDLMVGFPGETEEEFQESLAFAGEIAFAKAHVFAYSPRDGTPAAGMPHQVDEGEKARRSRLMSAALEEDRLAYFRSQVGLVREVLLERGVTDGKREGYTPQYVPVAVPATGTAAGDVLRVSITGAGPGGCMGIPLNRSPGD